MESVEAVKSESHVRSHECHREPALPQKFGSPVRHVVIGAIKDHETWRPRCGTWVWTSSVSQLNTKAKVSETILFEKLASPTLKTES